MLRVQPNARPGLPHRRHRLVHTLCRAARQEEGGDERSRAPMPLGAVNVGRPVDAVDCFYELYELPVDRNGSIQRGNADVVTAVPNTFGLGKLRRQVDHSVKVRGQLVSERTAA